jgi:di/tricarboxylate transporter
MTLEIALVFGILLGALVLFLTEWIRMDLVALLVLLAVGLTGLVSPVEALSGFSSPAVVTVWAMFIISGGLTLTGVADILGRRVIRIAGTGEVGLIVTIMATAGILSAFMNNVGVAAMMLPVVVQIGRRTGHAPSRLLMPLAMGCLLGGLTTLIGTPPNILVADQLREYGLRPFSLFEFTPIGGIILVTGIAFVAVVGRRLLPERDPMKETSLPARDPEALYALGERLFTVRLAPDSPLAGRTLAESRLGAALRMNVVAVIRDGSTTPAPPGDLVLRSDDRLLALGRTDLTGEVQGGAYLVEDPEPERGPLELLAELKLSEARVTPHSPLVGKRLFRTRLRERYGIRVLAIQRREGIRFRDLQDTRPEADDILLIHSPDEPDEALREATGLADFRPVSPEELRDVYGLAGTVLSLQVPPGSVLAGQTLREARLREVLGVDVWAIRRNGVTLVMPGPEDVLEPGDDLLVQGTPEDLETVHALRKLRIESRPTRGLESLQSMEVGVAELVLAPETTLTGQTPRELDFRNRYGVTVLAVWREGTAKRTNLRDLPLLFGDAILVQGPREKLRLLARDPDFVVLTEPPPPPPRQEKAPLAVGILALALAPVILGWLPIALGAISGAVAMVLTRCLTMEDAYRFIEWPAVFLIAGMLPLGIAMERTGAARFLADGMVSATGELGPRAVLAGLFLLTSLATQVIPTAALVVLMSPIALNAAADLGVSPYPLMMTVAMAASASLSSPVSHPANTLIMGPGGYRFVDYVRVGLPLTFLIFLIVVVLVPILWPFHP